VTAGVPLSPGFRCRLGRQNLEHDEKSIDCPACRDRPLLTRILFFKCTLCEDTRRTSPNHFRVWQNDARKRISSHS
jgi:hypothetical protein